LIEASRKAFVEAWPHVLLMEGRRMKMSQVKWMMAICSMVKASQRGCLGPRRWIAAVGRQSSQPKGLKAAIVDKADVIIVAGAGCTIGRILQSLLNLT
jgi:hypothetical protein